jgi:hypothetical protein
MLAACSSATGDLTEAFIIRPGRRERVAASKLHSNEATRWITAQASRGREFSMASPAISGERAERQFIFGLEEYLIMRLR